MRPCRRQERGVAAHPSTHTQSTIRLLDVLDQRPSVQSAARLRLVHHPMEWGTNRRAAKKHDMNFPPHHHQQLLMQQVGLFSFPSCCAWQQKRFVDGGEIVRHARWMGCPTRPGPAHALPILRSFHLRAHLRASLRAAQRPFQLNFFVASALRLTRARRLIERPDDCNYSCCKWIMARWLDRVYMLWLSAA